jgi:predicted neutral ceramidase superfamily lipid hydrolase
VEQSTATSTATSTPTESGPLSTLPSVVLPLIGASILGVDIKKVKNKVSLYLLILSVPTIIINILALTILSGKDILGLIGFWSFFNLNPGLSRLVLIAPLFGFFLSLLHNKSRETVYKAWLVYSVLGLVVLIYFVMYAEAHPGDWLMPAVFAIVGLAYVAGSVLIWLYGAVTHFFRKKTN